MPDSKYCYPDSDVLINKLNIMDGDELFEAEKQLTSKAVVELEAYNLSDDSSLRILTSDDLFIKAENKYYYYEYHESDQVSKYDEIYEERIRKLKDEEGN